MLTSPENGKPIFQDDARYISKHALTRNTCCSSMR